MVTFQQLLDAPVTSLPFKTLIDAWYDGTKQMSEFEHQVMGRLLNQLLTPSPHETAVRDTYFRICLYLRSIVQLNRFQDVQSVAAATRSIFELWIEVELLAKDPTGEAARKQQSFAELQRYRQAEQLIRFGETGAIEVDLSAQKAYCTDERKQRLIAEWGADKAGRPKDLPHWTGKDLRARSRELGHEAAYVQVQPLLSWYVHSTGAGTTAISRAGLEAVFGLSHMFAQRFFLAATQTCARVTRISELPEFAGWMRDMLQKSGRLILQEQLKQLEDAQAQPGKGGSDGT